MSIDKKKDVQNALKNLNLKNAILCSYSWNKSGESLLRGILSEKFVYHHATAQKAYNHMTIACKKTHKKGEVHDGLVKGYMIENEELGIAVVLQHPIEASALPASFVFVPKDKTTSSAVVQEEAMIA